MFPNFEYSNKAYPKVPGSFSLAFLPVITSFLKILIDFSSTKGSEQDGVRPSVVVQNNYANKASPNTVVCPITTNLSYYPHTVLVRPSSHNGLFKESKIDCLQIRVVSKNRILKKIGVLEQEYTSDLMQAFIISFDLHDYFN